MGTSSTIERCSFSVRLDFIHCYGQVEPRQRQLPPERLACLENDHDGRVSCRCTPLSEQNTRFAGTLQIYSNGTIGILLITAPLTAGAGRAGIWEHGRDYGGTSDGAW